MSAVTPSVAQPRVIGDLVPRTRVADVVLVVGAAGLTGLAAQVVVPLPFTPVPLTGQTFAVLLAGAALGTARGLLSMALYVVAGLVGVPWFAGGESGAPAATLGYLVGFVVAAAVVGRLAERGWDRRVLTTAAAMVVGNVVIYAIGVAGLVAALDVSVGKALDLGLVPFLGGDALKIALACGVLPGAWALRRRLTR